LTTIARRSISGNQIGLRKKALATLKIAAFAPMPRASVKIAAAVKPGLLRSNRRA
jgi:hypothetical protein